MNKEYWKPMVDYEKFFEISSKGRIRSLSREVIGRKNVIGKVLKHNLCRGGYPTIRLSINGKKFSKRLHREVAKAFIPNEKELPQVNHKDGNKTNNLINNLEWCNNSYNQKHAISNGLKITKTGKEAIRYKSPIHVYSKQGEYLYDLHGNLEIINKGFDYRLVSMVVHGKRKTHKGHIFRRPKAYSA